MQKSLLLTLLWAVIGLGAARAGYGETVDFGEMELGTPYQLNGDFSDYAGHFTATTSGTLTVSSSTSGNFMSPYADAEMLTPISFDLGYTVGGGCTYDIQVEAGQTYYFLKTFSMDSSTTTLTMGDDSAVSLVSIDPAKGSLLSPAGSGIFSIAFNRTVSVGSAALMCDGTEYSLVPNILGTMVSIQYKEALMKLIQGGKAVKGTPLKLVLKGVRSSSDTTKVYGTDGTVEIAYVCDEKPVTLVQVISQPEVFLSWWRPGDAAAVYAMEFDGALGEPTESQCVAQITYGDQEGEVGESYMETVPCTVEGNTLSVDFSGKLRRPQDMVASGTDYGVMTFRLANVRDAQGNLVYSEGLGTLGSFSEIFTYKEVICNVIPDFTPRSGSSLTGLQSIEIWLADYAAVQHDGVCFTYTDAEGEQQIVVRDITVTPDPDFEGAYALEVPIPEALKAKTLDNIVVMLNDATFADGIDHSAELSATYSIAPADGIGSICTDCPATGIWFDLSGRRTVRPVHGVYVRDGQKVLVK